MPTFLNAADYYAMLGTAPPAAPPRLPAMNLIVDPLMRGGNIGQQPMPGVLLAEQQSVGSDRWAVGAAENPLLEDGKKLNRTMQAADDFWKHANLSDASPADPLISTWPLIIQAWQAHFPFCGSAADSQELHTAAWDQWHSIKPSFVARGFTDPADEIIPGVTNTVLAIGAALLVGAVLLGKR